MLLHSLDLRRPFFDKRNPFNITCSKCYKGVLKNTGLVKDKTAAAKANEKERFYSPYEYEERICYLLVCNNRDCEESFLAVGTEFEDIDYIYDEYTDREERIDVMVFKPLLFTPAVHLFALHKAVPDSINENLLKSFSLFFLDSSSAANKVRIALEVLMDELNVPEINKGKRLSLHGRIAEFEKIDSVIGGQLLSIKLVGNLGSHAAGIDRVDVVTAYEIIEHVLDELYVVKQRRIEAQQKAQELLLKGKQKNTTVPKPAPGPPPPTKSQ